MIHLLVPVLKQGGVYDFACRIQEAIGPDSVRLVHISKENAADWKVGPGDSVVLHLSGYGYAKRGAPLWLLKKLEAERANIKTLGVYFHELYAFGPPWRSAFWLSPVQRHISRRIAELADFWITNREDSAEWLRRFAADKPHAVLPVFSNVGEMATYSPKRLPQIVVFGGAALRAATYRAAGDLLFIWTKAQGLELHDIGPAMDDQTINDSLTQAGAKVHGRLEAEEASTILSKASFGLVRYPVEYVAKSGVFAAYAAHGVCAILISEGYKTSDGLVSGENYLAGLPDELVNEAKAGRVGKAAWEWYQPHRVGSHVSTQLRFSQKASKRVN